MLNTCEHAQVIPDEAQGQGESVKWQGQSAARVRTQNVTRTRAQLAFGVLVQPVTKSQLWTQVTDQEVIISQLMVTDDSYPPALSPIDTQTLSL